jgi:type IV pilus assembly protein PilX
MAMSMRIRQPIVSAMPPRPRGAALMVALVFMLLLAILAIGAMRSAVLQEKMVGAVRNQQLAGMGAESALRAAEFRLWSASISAQPVICGAAALGGCFSYVAGQPNAAVQAFVAASGWYSAGGTSYATQDMTTLAGTQVTARLAVNPVFLIEDLGIETPPGLGPARESGATGPKTGPGSTDKHLYRITARSTGGNANSLRVVQTTFAAKSN